jgi:hypothetical protein
LLGDFLQPRERDGESKRGEWSSVRNGRRGNRQRGAMWSSRLVSHAWRKGGPGTALVDAPAACAREEHGFLVEERRMPLGPRWVVAG